MLCSGRPTIRSKLKPPDIWRYPTGLLPRGFLPAMPISLGNDVWPGFYRRCNWFCEGLVQRVIQ